MKQGKATFIHKNRVNVFIVNELDPWSRDLKTGFTLGDEFFGVVKLMKNVCPDK